MTKKHRRAAVSSRDRLAAELARRYNEGESVRALAAASGRSYGFIHRLLIEYGVDLRGRRRGGTQL
ncbi:helix-turn-helix domain-containing protein [Spirillospora sp. CA-253888]